MKYLIGSIVTIIIGYIFSGMLSGVGVSDAYMSYINEVTLSVIFLSGIVSFWGYLILDKLNKEKDLNEEIYNITMIKLDEVKILHLAYFVFKNKEENTMIISIWKKQDLQLIKELPTEVLSAIETTIEMLDENYGTERTAEDQNTGF